MSQGPPNLKDLDPRTHWYPTSCDRHLHGRHMSFGLCIRVFHVIDVKKTLFYVFYPGHVFTFFNVFNGFLFFQRFFFIFKNVHWKYHLKSLSKQRKIFFVPLLFNVYKRFYFYFCHVFTFFNVFYFFFWNVFTSVQRGTTLRMWNVNVTQLATIMSIKVCLHKTWPAVNGIETSTAKDNTL